MDESTPEEKSSDSPLVCANCRGGEVEPGFELPLCIRCRTLLARRPFPTWIRNTCIALLVILAFATFLSIDSYRAGIAFERGQQAERRGDFALAANLYGQVVDRFPESTLALARLAVAQFRAGQLPEAARALNRLKGRKTSPKLAAEVNQVIQAMSVRQPRNWGE